MNRSTPTNKPTSSGHQTSQNNAARADFHTRPPMKLPSPVRKSPTRGDAAPSNPVPNTAARLRAVPTTYLPHTRPTQKYIARWYTSRPPDTVVSFTSLVTGQWSAVIIPGRYLRCRSCFLVFWSTSGNSETSSSTAFLLFFSLGLVCFLAAVFLTTGLAGAASRLRLRW